MNRRDFLLGMGAGLSPLLIGYYKMDNHIESVMDKRDLREGEFLSSLEKYVVSSETKIVCGVINNNVTGMGVVYNNGKDDFYFTLGHIVDYTEGMPVRTPFGVIKTRPDDLEFSTNIKGVELEKVIFDDSDVAVFKVPKHLRVNRFPLEARTKVYLGERVAVLGNPMLGGYHPRIGRVTDIDGVKVDDNVSAHNYKTAIGTDIDVSQGDSGTPVISMRDKKLVGIMGLHFGGMSYFQPIKEFLRYVE